MTMTTSIMVRSVWRATVGLRINGIIPVVKYVSVNSGLRVVVADVEGPIVATETDTDAGLPHTLEHLVFMGSKEYPFKGVLDILASRCLASGTNAWTDQDHTAYTLSTVGQIGFLKVLPVYMDHLLSPQLTDSQYATEVHHIDGEGEDAGVVYCEMQDYESDMSHIISCTSKRLLYPDGCPYRVETGGRLADIRSSCTSDLVRQFHQQFYHLANMTIVVCGPIDHDQLLSTIESVECRYKSPIGTFIRPFQTPFVARTESIETIVDCPSDDDAHGIVRISWLGAPANSFYNETAFDVLFEYMQATASSPLERDFIQLSDAYCSSVSIDYEEQSIGEIVLQFEGVPFDKLQLIRPRLFETTIASMLTDNGLDMERFGFIIDRCIRESLSALETSPHNTLFDMMTGDQVYGHDDTFNERINDIENYMRLHKENSHFWHRLITDYIGINRPHVCVIGRPNMKLVDEITQKENERIELQRKRLGKNGLADCGRQLAKAIDTNTSNKPTDEILDQFIVRELTNVNCHRITESSNRCAKSTDTDINFRLVDVPFRMSLYNCNSKFVEVTVVMDTAQISTDQRRLLLLYFELIFESGAYVDGHLLSYQDIGKLFTRDLVSQHASLGINGFFSRFVTFTVKVDQKSYENAAKWIKIFLTGIVFDADRIKSCALKLVNEAAAAKREGDHVCRMLLDRNIYGAGNNCFCVYRNPSPIIADNAAMCHLIRLEQFHSQLAAAVDRTPTSVIAKLNDLRESLTASTNVHVYVSCNAAQLADNYGKSQLATVWKSCFAPVESMLPSIPTQFDPIEQLNACSFGKVTICAMGSSESAFMQQSAKLQVHDDDPHLPACLVLVQYLTQCEGPLWRRIRGTGIAYGANIDAVTEQALISLSIYRSTDVVKAYKEMISTVLAIIDGRDPLNPSEFEAAKRSLVFEIIKQESTIDRACQQAMIARFRGLPIDYHRQLCDKIWSLNMAQTIASAADYIRPLFDAKTAATSIVVHPSKLKSVLAGFKKILSKTEIEVLNLDDNKLQYRFD